MQLRISIWFLTFNFIFGQNQTWTVYYHQTGQQDIYSSHCSEIGSVEDPDTHVLYCVWHTDVCRQNAEIFVVFKIS